MKRKTKTNRRQKVDDRVENLIGLKSSTDVNGSYTGTPLDGGKPVQDADDL